MSKFPITLVLNGDVEDVALMNDQYERNAKGQIEATFNDAQELQDCLDATLAIRGAYKAMGVTPGDSEAVETVQEAVNEVVVVDNAW